MTPQMLEAAAKAGTAVILSIGMILILYTVVKDDKAEQAFRDEHMQRQTEALEKLVDIYSGE